MTAVLRDAAIAQPMFTVPAHCQEWFVKVANFLAESGGRGLDEVAESLAHAAHAHEAPTILAIIAPQSTFASCPNREILGSAKLEVEKHLPALLARIIARWNDGAFPVGANLPISA